jgi:hypothetical protein
VNYSKPLNGFRKTDFDEDFKFESLLQDRSPDGTQLPRPSRKRRRKCVLAAVGYNFRRLIHWLRHLLQFILRATQAAAASCRLKTLSFKIDLHCQGSHKEETSPLTQRVGIASQLQRGNCDWKVELLASRGFARRLEKDCGRDCALA